jgi:hypothetical protein
MYPWDVVQQQHFNNCPDVAQTIHLGVFSLETVYITSINPFPNCNIKIIWWYIYIWINGKWQSKTCDTMKAVSQHMIGHFTVYITSVGSCVVFIFGPNKLEQPTSYQFKKNNSYVLLHGIIIQDESSKSNFVSNLVFGHHSAFFLKNITRTPWLTAFLCSDNKGDVSGHFSNISVTIGIFGV